MRLIFIFLLSTLALVSNAQAELIGPAAGAALERQLNSDVDERIKQAQAAADFATLNMLLRVKSALEAVREQGGALIDQASADANKQSYQSYLQIRAAVDATGERTAELEAAALQAQQIAENLPMASRRTFIVNYSPKVTLPTAKEDVRIRVSGVNLDGSKPAARLNGKPLRVIPVGMQELIVVVPSALLARSLDGLTFNEVKVTYLSKASFFSRLFDSNRVERTLSVVTLPMAAGRLRVTGQAPVTSREYQPFKADVSLSGYGEQRGIQLPGEGWKFDLEKPIDVTQGGGEKGTCYGIDMPASSKEGLVVKANNSRRWKRGRRIDGWVVCKVTAQRYRENTTVEPFRTQQFTLGWTKPIYV